MFFSIFSHHSRCTSFSGHFLAEHHRMFKETYQTLDKFTSFLPSCCSDWRWESMMALDANTTSLWSYVCTLSNPVHWSVTGVQQRQGIIKTLLGSNGSILVIKCWKLTQFIFLILLNSSCKWSIRKIYKSERCTTPCIQTTSTELSQT